MIYNNLQGPNARVNIDSTDYSVNIANSEEIFAQLRKAIEAGIEDTGLKEQLLTKTVQLEQTLGKPAYLKRYTEWVAIAANHMEILGPFIPALTQFLQALPS